MAAEVAVVVAAAAAEGEEAAVVVVEEGWEEKWITRLSLETKKIKTRQLRPSGPT